MQFSVAQLLKNDTKINQRTPKYKLTLPCGNIKVSHDTTVEKERWSKKINCLSAHVFFIGSKHESCSALNWITQATSRWMVTSPKKNQLKFKSRSWQNWTSPKPVIAAHNVRCGNILLLLWQSLTTGIFSTGALLCVWISKQLHRDLNMFVSECLHSLIRNS